MLGTYSDPREDGESSSQSRPCARHSRSTCNPGLGLFPRLRLCYSCSSPLAEGSSVPFALAFFSCLSCTCSISPPPPSTCAHWPRPDCQSQLHFMRSPTFLPCRMLPWIGCSYLTFSADRLPFRGTPRRGGSWTCRQTLNPKQLGVPPAEAGVGPNCLRQGAWRAHSLR